MTVHWKRKRDIDGIVHLGVRGRRRDKGHGRKRVFDAIICRDLLDAQIVTILMPRVAMPVTCVVCIANEGLVETALAALSP